MALKLARVTIVVLCATAVLVVLITPAFDELPSTLPHGVHSVLLPATSHVFVPLLAVEVVWSVLGSPHFVSGHDLLSLNCTRIC